jgi:hypothetical protein
MTRATPAMSDLRFSPDRAKQAGWKLSRHDGAEQLAEARCSEASGLAEHDDRIHAGRAPRRHETGGHGDKRHDAADEGEGHRISR